MSSQSSECKHPYKPHISYNNHGTSYCLGIKFLGMNITENLNWPIHVHSLFASLSGVYYITKSLKDVMSLHMI
jgi:hypothetical protein